MLSNNNTGTSTGGANYGIGADSGCRGECLWAGAFQGWGRCEAAEISDHGGMGGGSRQCDCGGADKFMGVHGDYSVFWWFLNDCEDCNGLTYSAEESGVNRFFDFFSLREWLTPVCHAGGRAIMADWRQPLPLRARSGTFPAYILGSRGIGSSRAPCLRVPIPSKPLSNWW